jgi:hypothetical protein
VDRSDRTTSRYRAPSRKGKVRKEFWLDPAALRQAKAILGTATERDTVELALDLVAFRQEVLAGVRALGGLKIARRP